MSTTCPELRSAVLLLAAALPLSACLPSIEDDFADDSAAARAVVSTTDEAGVTSTRIDARASDRWVYVDLDVPGGKALPELADPASAPDWDVAFQRFKVKLNGGASGKGGVEVAGLLATPFESLTAAPTDGYRSDAAGTEDTRLAFLSGDGWYEYRILEHSLFARPGSWVLKSTAGARIGLAFTGYYDPAGSSGFPGFRWKVLSPAAP